MLDWEDLRSFLAVARHGTLSGAAKVLGVQQSTIGRRLAAFEARAGVLLLQKTPRGYVLTAAGEAARAEAEKMEVAALAAERAITGRDARLEGEIRLTTVESLAAEMLVPILAGFARIYPGIFVKLIVGTRVLSLASREADLALRLARPSGGDLMIRKLGDLAFGFYASAEYVERHGTEFGDGAGQRIILMEDDVPTFTEIVALTQRFPVAEVAMRSNSRYAASGGVPERHGDCVPGALPGGAAWAGAFGALRGAAGALAGAAPRYATYAEIQGAVWSFGDRVEVESG